MLNKQPLLAVLISFILGILVQELVSFSWREVMFGLIFGSFSLFGFLVRKRIMFRLRLFFLAVFFISIGIFSHFLNNQPSYLPNIPADTDIIFSLDKKLNSNEKNKRYEVSAFHNKMQFKCLVSIPNTEQELDFKHLYKAKVRINKVDPPKNNYQFNYAQYLKRKNIYFQAYVYNDLQKIEKQNISFKESIKQKRLNVLENINQSQLSIEVKAFLKSIILADRTDLDQRLVSDFQRSGLIHLLAISGTHIGVIFGAIFWLLINILPLKFRKFATIISLLSVWLFALFIGGGNPVIRACAMLTSYFGFQILQRKVDTLHALALAGFIILVMDTQQVFDVGFQLSFSAVLGIFLFNKPIAKYFPKPKKYLQRILLYTFTLSLSAQLGTMPFILYYFHQYSLITIVANVLVIPFAQIYIILSFIMAFIIGLRLNIWELEWFYNESVLVFLRVIKYFGNQEWALFSLIPFSLSEVFVAMIGLYFLRNFIITSNFINSLRLIFIVLIFIGLNLALNIYEYQKSETVVHYYFKEKILSVKKQNIVYFYVKENSNISKIEQYIIKPYLISRRTNQWEVITIPKNISKIKINHQLYDIK